jgi:prephenate dehydrogenase
MDMASVKGAVAAGARRLQGANRHFIPCHPMAGREKSGVRFADAELYRGRRVVLTPLPGTPRALRSRAFALWRKTGAVLCVMGARVHDSRVAITSHLPHLLACALTESFGEALRKDPGVRLVVGTGFLDVTRIAASSPAMWSDIVALNAPEIRRRLSALRRRLASLERSLGPGRSSRWGRFFARTKAVREGLS